MCGNNNCQLLYAKFYPESANQAEVIFDADDDCCGHPHKDCLRVNEVKRHHYFHCLQFDMS